MTVGAMASPSKFIDLDRYPLDGRDPRRLQAVIAAARAQLADDGCCVLPGFVTAAALPLLVDEADAVADNAHRSFNRTNAYFSDDDPSLPDHDPRRRFYDRSDRVRSLVLVPGDLQIFKGRYALHRVTPVGGARRRYVGIFSFVETEDMVGSVERTRQLYGRVLPIHLERAGMRGDRLKD